MNDDGIDIQQALQDLEKVGENLREIEAKIDTDVDAENGYVQQ